MASLFWGRLVDGEAWHGGEALETSFITCTFQNFGEEKRGEKHFGSLLSQFGGDCLAALELSYFGASLIVNLEREQSSSYSGWFPTLYFIIPAVGCALWFVPWTLSESTALLHLHSNLCTGCIHCWESEFPHRFRFPPPLPWAAGAFPFYGRAWAASHQPVVRSRPLTAFSRPSPRLTEATRPLCERRGLRRPPAAVHSIFFSKN
eukprot:Gb_18814 [translate_table: standard]